MTEIITYNGTYKEDIVNLILTIQTIEFEVPVTLDMQPDLNKIDHFYQTGNGNFWIALNNNKVIGTIALLDIGNDQGALRKMFVDANFRGSEHKVGQKLLDQLFAWAKQKGFQELVLGTTEKFAAAKRFNKKNWFIEME